MDFSRHQLDAARTTRRLRVAYVVAVVAVVLVFNGAALSVWRLLFGDAPLPYGFLLVNTLATAGLIVAGTLIERQRLADDAGLLPERLGARALMPGVAAQSLLERRVINVVEEMALAAHQPIPRLYVLETEASINALATGLTRESAAVVLTRGAIERLNRDELQGVVAHEIAHLASGDVVVNTQLAAMNYGLELVSNAGRRAVAAALPDGLAASRSPGSVLSLVLLIPGLLLMSVGSIGHLAALLLAAAIGRTREFHADALAVRLTREPTGLGNALRKVAWIGRHEPSSGRVGVALHGLEHALLSATHRGLSDWLATHPPLAARISRLLGADAVELRAERAADDDTSLSLDASRAAAWLARSALPALAYSADESTLAGRPTLTGAPESVRQVRRVRRQDLAALVAAAQHANSAAALTALLILGNGVEAEVWPQRWQAALTRQGMLAERLRRLGPGAVERLRWPLLELCAATIRPLAAPWHEDLLRMLRGQIELDQCVTLAEWIYYMLLRARLLPVDDRAWRGDEATANPAEAVRWLVALLGSVVGEPALRSERTANEIVRALALSRTGQSYPPLDVGGMQAAVASLRHLPMLQRPLLMKQLVAILPAEAPVEARDFLRVLALIIDCPLPHFLPVRMETPETGSMPTEMTLLGPEPAALVS